MIICVIYRKPPNIYISPGLIFVRLAFLWAYTLGVGGFIRMIGVSNNIFCTCNLYREQKQCMECYSLAFCLRILRVMNVDVEEI